MKSNPSSLNFLYLNSNKIGVGGAKVLGKLNLCHLKTLDLSDNLLTDNAVVWLAKGNYIELSTVQLAQNKITA